LSGLPGYTFSMMQVQLNELYAPCTEHCTHDHYTMSNTDDWAGELAKLLAKEAQRVWRLKGMPENISPQLTEAYATILMEAVEKGFAIDYDTPDEEMLKDLSRNVYQFSAAKNYTQLRQLTQALIGSDGKLRSFAGFKTAAFEINNEHVANWLKAEYDTAVGSAQMARKWSEIQSTKESLPLLRFNAVLDGGTTQLCRSLDGVVKPVNDPIWRLYYPPNHFRCRSIVDQLPSGRITPDYEITYPDNMPDMFKTNMAETGAVFPANHPYFIGAPQSVMNEAAKLYKKSKYGKG
jgi:SPP1 gp7 family putative phage head morphogenesis protein